MKKNGFTLVELLAVIVVLSIIVGIAIPISLTVSRNIKKNMFCKKIKMIEEAAINYGQDNYSLINSGSEGTVIRISDLVLNGYLKKDVKDANVGSGAIISPIDNKSLDNFQIKLYINNNISKNRIRAVCIENDCNNLCD